MASLVLTAVGNAALPGIGGVLLGTLGRFAGGVIDQQLGLTGSRKLIGPRLENLKVQDSRYGAGIAILYGRARVAGQVIWASDLQETAHEDQIGGGGKGGTGSVSSTTYSYSLSCAIAIGQGIISRLVAVWADGKQIYDGLNWQSSLVTSASFYHGATDQSPDPVLQGALGIANVPAYRGIAYVVLENMQLANFGNRLPNLTFEVIANEAAADPQIATNTYPAMQNVGDGYATMGGTPPLLLVGNTRQASQMLVAGMQNVSTANSAAAFLVTSYDVNGEQPQEIGRVASPAFSINDSLAGLSWARSPDQRYIAMLATSAAYPLMQATLILYDVATQQFGSPLQIMLQSFTKSIVWLDALRCMVADHNGSQLGVQIISRVGRNLTVQGFYSVWGAGSASNRATIGTAHFIPVANGWLMITGNSGLSPTILYGCHVRWAAGQVATGSPFVLAANVPANSLNRADAIALGEGEFCFIFRLVDRVVLCSFMAYADNVMLTRPWQSIMLSVLSNDTAPCRFGNHLLILQNSIYESIYRLSEIRFDNGHFTLTTDAVAVNGGDAVSRSYYQPLALDYHRLLVQGGDPFGLEFSELRILSRHAGGDTIQHIVGDVLQRAGYAAADYQLSALGATSVTGYILQPPFTGRGAIEPLRLYHAFDLIESDDLLRAVTRRAVIDVDLPDSELRASHDVTKIPPALRIKRVPDSALPDALAIDYLDPVRDFEIGSQQARRTLTQATTRRKISLPVICSADAAKQIAETRLYAAWAERDTGKMFLSRRYFMLDAGDVVRVAGRTMRLQQIQQSGGLLQCDVVQHDATVEVNTAQSDAGAVIAANALQPVPSVLYCLDLPPLLASDDQAGFYVAVGGAAGWQGAALWRAQDDIHYRPLQSLTMAVTSGFASSVLPASASEYMDVSNAVEVQLFRGNLASCTMAELLNGANAALLGDEIIQFQTATLLGDGHYRLSGLLRGRKGTEAAIDGHNSGEDFLLLSASMLQFVPLLTTDRGQPYSYKAVTTGQAIAEASAQSFACALRTQQPLAPAHLSGVRAAGIGSDLGIQWVRRARLNAEWLDYIDVPLDEASEAYDLEICDSGGVIRRTVNGLTQNSFFYRAAQQAADFSSIPTSYNVRVYQVSTRYGRGVAATATI